MSPLTKLSRVAVPLFSLTLLAGYVVYSHVTPNTPPPSTMMSGSKYLSQPVFSTRKVSTGQDPLQVRADRRLIHGSKSGLVELLMPEFLNVEFVNFGTSLEPFSGFKAHDDSFPEAPDTLLPAISTDVWAAPSLKP